MVLKPTTLAQVIKPSRERFDDMMTKVPDLDSHDGGDTGFLNSYYKGWFTTGAEHRLPFGYCFIFIFIFFVGAAAPLFFCAASVAC